MNGKRMTNRHQATARVESFLLDKIQTMETPASAKWSRLPQPATASFMNHPRAEVGVGVGVGVKAKTKSLYSLLPLPTPTPTLFVLNKSRRKERSIIAEKPEKRLETAGTNFDRLIADGWENWEANISDSRPPNRDLFCPALPRWATLTV